MDTKEVINGLEMIDKRYWFGMFTTSDSERKYEKEYLMRDALQEAIRILKEKGKQ